MSGIPPQRLKRIELDPSLLAPYLNEVGIIVVQIVPGVEGSYRAAPEPERQNGGIFHLDRLPSHVAAKAGHARDPVTRQIVDQIQVMDAVKRQLAAAGAILVGHPQRLPRSEER